jgi:hypothetical protein
MNITDHENQNQDTISNYSEQNDGNNDHAHCAARIQYLEKIVGQRDTELAALRDSNDIKEKECALLKEALDNLSNASKDGADRKWSNRIKALARKVSQAEHSLAKQSQNFEGILKKYILICQDIENARKRSQQENNAILKHLSAHTLTLLDQKTKLIENEMQFNEFFYRQELH